VPETNNPKPDEPQGGKRADAGLASAHQRIETAKEELARLDRLVAGMEHGSDRPPIRQTGTGPEPVRAAASEAPAPRQRLEDKVYSPSVRRTRVMLLALVGFLLTIGIFGAAFASRYGNEAKAIMARWAPPASTAHNEASEPPGPKELVLAQAAAPPAQPAPPAAPIQPAAPSQKEMKDVPPAGTTESADRTAADLAQSLKTITNNLAGINAKLDQLKSGYDQKLREQADTIQQLKAAEEQNARDNARLGERMQALQVQPAASSAKPAAPPPKKESDAAVQQRPSVAFQPPRPRRPSAPWRPRSYMDGSYYDDPYW